MTRTGFAKPLLKACTLAVTALFLPGTHAAVWDATADFSAVSNANGVWSYGSTSTLSGAFTLFANAQTLIGTGTGSIDAWNATADSVPLLGKAGISGFDSYGTVTVAPNSLDAHAGANGEYAVLRFTAPTAMSFQVNASFWSNDFVRPSGNDVDVHVRAGGTDLFSASVFGYGPSSLTTWSGTLALSAGQTVDFMVGRGVDNNYTFGSTGLNGAVSAVPEPTTAALLLLGVGGLALARRRL